MSMTGCWQRFQSTSSARRTTRDDIIIIDPEGISIHVLRKEDDPGRYHHHRSRGYFNPRPPQGGRRIPSCRSFRRGYFNPRPPQGGRQVGRERSLLWLQISIHVLREEDDCYRWHYKRQYCYFNPRPPRGGRRSLTLSVFSISRISIHVLREEDDRTI